MTTLYVDPIPMPPESTVLLYLRRYMDVMDDPDMFKDFTPVTTDDEQMCEYAMVNLNQLLPEDYMITRVLDMDADGSPSGGYYFLTDLPGSARIATYYIEWRWLRGGNREGIEGVVDYLGNVVRSVNDSIHRLNVSIESKFQSARPTSVGE